MAKEKSTFSILEGIVKQINTLTDWEATYFINDKETINKVFFEKDGYKGEIDYNIDIPAYTIHLPKNGKEAVYKNRTAAIGKVIDYCNKN